MDGPAEPRGRKRGLLQQTPGPSLQTGLYGGSECRAQSPPWSGEPGRATLHHPDSLGRKAFRRQHLSLVRLYTKSPVGDSAEGLLQLRDWPDGRGCAHSFFTPSPYICRAKTPRVTQNNDWG